ncbi:MAG: DUF11 domain-containing protein, partial [Verrucomicrobiota bacterium]
IYHTTISGNRAGDSAIHGNGGSGGGFAGDGLLFHCTVSGNAAGTGGVGNHIRDAQPPGDGGGVYGNPVIAHSTIAFNRTGYFSCGLGTVTANSRLGHGGGVYSLGGMRLEHSIVYGNEIPAFDANFCHEPVPAPGGGIGPDGYGDIQSGGYNLIGNPAGANLTGDLTGNITSQNAWLNPLGANGGVGWTHTLAPASPAIDGGDPAIPSPPDVDQRGHERIAGGRIDIGAVEVGALLIQSDLSLRKQAPPSVDTNSLFQYRITVTNQGAALVSGIVVTDTIPAELTFVSAPPACTLSNQVLTCHLSPLDVGMGTSLIITVRSPVQAGGLITNHALVASASPDVSGWNNQDLAVTEIGRSELRVLIDGPVAGVAASNLIYDLSVSNRSVVPALDVVAEFELDDHLIFLAASRPDCTVSNGR